MSIYGASWGGMGANLRSRIDEEQAADDRGHTFVDEERSFVNADQAAAKGTGIKGYAGGTGKGPESSIRHSMKMMAFPLNFLWEGSWLGFNHRRFWRDVRRCVPRTSYREHSSVDQLLPFVFLILQANVV